MNAAAQIAARLAALLAVAAPAEIAAFIRDAQTPVALPDGEYPEGEGHGLTEAQQRTLAQYLAAIPANMGRVITVRDGVVSTAYRVA